MIQEPDNVLDVFKCIRDQEDFTCGDCLPHEVLGITIAIGWLSNRQHIAPHPDFRTGWEVTPQGLHWAYKIEHEGGR